MPNVSRPKTKPLFLALDADVRDELDRFVEQTGRDYKTEVSFALAEHFKRGPLPLPAGFRTANRGRK